MNEFCGNWQVEGSFMKGEVDIHLNIAQTCKGYSCGFLRVGGQCEARPGLMYKNLTGSGNIFQWRRLGSCDHLLQPLLAVDLFFSNVPCGLGVQSGLNGTTRIPLHWLQPLGLISQFLLTLSGSITCTPLGKVTLVCCGTWVNEISQLTVLAECVVCVCE